MFKKREVHPNDHVLIVLGHHGHPTFKTIDLNTEYLDKLGERMVGCKKSQYQRYKVISSHNVFTLTNPDSPFDEAIDQIIRDLILDRLPKHI